MIENYKCKFKSHGKFIFVPSSVSDKKAERLIAFGASIELPDYFFHYRPGGHVDALHRHLESRHFFRVDLKNSSIRLGEIEFLAYFVSTTFPAMPGHMPSGPPFVIPTQTARGMCCLLGSDNHLCSQALRCMIAQSPLRLKMLGPVTSSFQSISMI